MSVSLSGFTYGPAPYVQKNGGEIGASMTVNLNVDPVTFDFRLDWLDSTGTVWSSTGDLTLNTTGLSTPVSNYFTPSSALPPGGIRPQVTIDAGAAGTHTEQFCTGITAVPPKKKCPCDQPCATA